MFIRDYDAAYTEIQTQMETAGKMARKKRENDAVETATDQRTERADLRPLLHNLNNQNGSENRKTLKKSSLTNWSGLFRYVLILIIQTVMIFSSVFMNFRNKLVLIISSSLMYHIMMQQTYKAHETTTIV